MSKKPDLTKLPRYAQDFIQDLQRQRDVAVEKLDQFTDGQTKSRIYVHDFSCTDSPPEFRKKYVQASRIDMVLSENEEDVLQFDLKDGCVSVNGRARLSIKPCASNVIEISMEER